MPHLFPDPHLHLVHLFVELQDVAGLLQTLAAVVGGLQQLLPLGHQAVHTLADLPLGWVVLLDQQLTKLQPGTHNSNHGKGNGSHGNENSNHGKDDSNHGKRNSNHGKGNSNHGDGEQ